MKINNINLKFLSLSLSLSLSLVLLSCEDTIETETHKVNGLSKRIEKCDFSIHGVYIDNGMP